MPIGNGLLHRRKKYELEPGGAASREVALEDFGRELAALDAQLAELLGNRRLDLVVVQHPAWRRLLERYGVRELAVEADGKALTAERLADLAGEIDARGVEVLVAQHGLSNRALEVLARETGARTVTLDPLARDFPEALVATGQVLAQALE